MSLIARILALAGFVALVGCASPQQIAVERSLKAATSRSTGCPAQKLTIEQRRRTHSWTARGCDKTYRCTSINLEMELAECSGSTVAHR